MINHNPVAPFTTLVAGDKEYSLLWNYNAIATAENLSGLRLLSASIDLSSLSASELRALLYAAMLKKHPKITLNAVGDLIQQVGMRKVAGALLGAWIAAQPVPDPNDVPESENGEPATES